MFKRNGQRRNFRTRLEINEIFQRTENFIQENMDAVVNDENDKLIMDDEEIQQIVEILREQLKLKQQGKTITHKRHSTFSGKVKGEAIRRFFSLRGLQNDVI